MGGECSPKKYRPDGSIILILTLYSQPFFNEILSAGNTKLASAFIPKCTNLPVSDRIDMWVKCGMVIKAAEEALKSKDVSSLEMLKDKASGTAVNEIERMISQLRRR